MTRITKRYRAQKNFMFLLHFLIPILAAISLIVIGFITGTKKTSTSIVASMMIAAILLMINVVKKVKLTCIPYIILIRHIEPFFTPQITHPDLVVGN